MATTKPPSKPSLAKFPPSKHLSRSTNRSTFFQSLLSSLSFSSEPDRIMSSDSTKHKTRDTNIPLLGISTVYFLKAVKLDLKVNLFAISFTLVTSPFLLLVMYVVHTPQFNAHLGLPYYSSSPLAPPTPYFTQSETLFVLMGLNRLLWALWIINLRHWSSKATDKLRRHKGIYRFLPFVIETASIVVSYTSSPKIRESRFLTVTTYSVAMYVGTMTEIIVNSGFHRFIESLFFNAVVVPVAVAILFYLMPILMVVYAYSLELFNFTPLIEFAVISMLYPGAMMLTKNFMLGKIGSSILLNKKGSHLNDDFDRSEGTLHSYTGTVRAIHGLWLPQVVGIFLTLDASISLFVATLLFRVVFQSIGKYTLWILERDLIKTLAKRDGVYDENKLEMKKRPWMGSKSKNNKVVTAEARKELGFVAPSAINIHAQDFHVHHQNAR